MSEGQRLIDEHLKKPACAVCGKRCVPLKNGMMRPHNRDAWSGSFYRTQKCPGSGGHPLTPRPR